MTNFGFKSSEYKVHILSPIGELRSVVTDFTSLHLLREVNSIGDLVITLRGDHPALADLEYKCLLEVWRRDRTHRLDWYCEARYIYLYYSHSTKEIGSVEIKGVDPLWFLSTRIIAWDPNIANRSIFTHSAGMTIKLLVKYNATAAATVAAGRLREGNIPEITLEDIGTTATMFNWECSYLNLLTTCQDLVAAGAALNDSGDFTMQYSGAGMWLFRWREFYLGEDRSTSLTFSLALGNMSDPVYVLDRLAEKTVAIVGGGVLRDHSRASLIRTSLDYAADNDSELWVTLPGVIDTASMQAGADAALYKKRMIDALTFKCFQTPSAFYGVDYFLGDLVTTIYQGVSRVQQIHSLAIDAAPTGETSLAVSVATDQRVATDLSVI
jgi:hypothetical protein